MSARRLAAVAELTEPAVTLKDPLLTTEETSGYTSIPAVTLRQWRHRQEGPRSFKLGGAVRYRQSDLDAWIAYQEQKTAVGGVR